jgi:asparagine synthase (glutamine-hydrolysing)
MRSSGDAPRERMLATPHIAVRMERDEPAVDGQTSGTFGREMRRASGGSDGVFATWTWDGRRLTVRNDRYGFQPIYYWAHGRHQIAVSPSPLKLLTLGAAADLDDAAMAVFLRVGFFLGEDTPFRAIRAMPPGGALEWEGGDLRVQTAMARPRPQRMPRAVARDLFIETFREAVRRRLEVADAVAMPLSGGRDSRHIFLEMLAQQARPKIVVTLKHFAPKANQDALVAAQLAARSGLAHVVLEQPTSQVRAELVKNRETGFCTDEHAWILPMASYLRDRVSAFFDGIGGDVLSAGLFLDEEGLSLFQSGQIARLADRYLSTEEEGRLRVVLDGTYYRRWNRAIALMRVADELQRHADAPNPVGSFFFWNRTRREIALAPFGILSRVGTALTPYLDHDVYDLLASLPAEVFLDHEFHTEAIRRAYPEFAEVPFEIKGREESGRTEAARRLARGVLGYALLHPRWRFVDRRRWLLRLSRAATKNGYPVEWLHPLLGLYLIQLQEELRPT